jgi:hypothetical protein
MFAVVCLMLDGSNVARIFQPQSFMITPSDTSTRRKSRAAVRRRTGSKNLFVAPGSVTCSAWP